MSDGSTFTLQNGSENPQALLSYATWMDGSLVYVYNNNIYVRRVPTTTGADVSVTANGIPGEFFNGVPDWVYEGILI